MHKIIFSPILLIILLYEVLDVKVMEESQKVDLFLDKEDTSIGELIHKPKDYWYEIELNPDTEPQTLVGYDDEGAKIFRLFPEGSVLDVD